MNIKKENWLDQYFSFYKEGQRVVDTYEIVLVKDESKFQEMTKFIDSGYDREELEDSYDWENYINELEVDIQDLLNFIQSFDPSLLASVFIGNNGKENYSEDSLIVELK